MQIVTDAAQNGFFTDNAPGGYHFYGKASLE
jgi:hypothetical protein